MRSRSDRDESATAAKRLYSGINDRDPELILDSMTEDFVGQVSLGMPLDVGGRHEGRERMLREVWGPVFAAYDVTLEVKQYLAFDEHVVVVIGSYVGVERATGHPLDARFAHVLTIREGRIAGLEQITDTRRWPSTVSVA